MMKNLCPKCKAEHPRISKVIDGTYYDDPPENVSVNPYQKIPKGYCKVVMDCDKCKYHDEYLKKLEEGDNITEFVNMHYEAQKFLNLLDKYLIADLKTMVEEVSGRLSGGLGFPVIQTMISGMELLGIVLSGGQSTGRNAFYYFWDNYLAKESDDYKNDDLKDIFYSAIRHGTAHYFLVKNNIQISKDGDNHLAIVQNELRIDLKVLFQHFKNAYKNIKRSLLIGFNDELLRSFYQGLRKLIKDLDKSNTQETIKKYIEYRKNINFAKSFDQQIRGQSHSNVNPLINTSISGTKTLIHNGGIKNHNKLKYKL